MFYSFRLAKGLRMIMAPGGPRLGFGGRHGWISLGASGIRGGSRGLPVNIGIRDSDLFGANEVSALDGWAPPVGFASKCVKCRKPISGRWAGPIECLACGETQLIRSRGTERGKLAKNAVGLPMLHDACGHGTAIEVRKRISACFECGGLIEMPFSPLSVRGLADQLAQPHYAAINLCMNRFFVQETTGYAGMAALMKAEWQVDVVDDVPSEAGDAFRDVAAVDIDAERKPTAAEKKEQDDWAKKATSYSSFRSWLDAGYRAQAEAVVALFDPNAGNALLSPSEAKEIANVNFHHIIPEAKIKAVKRRFGMP